MIPDIENFWLKPPALTQPSTGSTIAFHHPSAVTSGVAANSPQLLLLTNGYHEENSPQHHYQQQKWTAWTRYCYVIEAMKAQGHKFNQRLMLEAMFRGNDLVYSSDL